MKSLQKISELRLSYLVSLFVLCGVLLVFLPVVLFSIYQVVNRGETRYTQMEAGRSENIIQNDLSQLDVVVHGISSWDDTYRFVQDKNQAYIDNNLSDNTFIGIHMNVFIALNSAREVVFARHFDTAAQSETPFPFDVASFLQAYPAMLNFPDIHSGVQGLVNIAGQPMLVIARPVTTSLEDGPERGAIIVGRWADAEEMAAISKLAQRKVSVLPAGTAHQQIPALPAASALKDQVFVQPRDSDISVGYKYLKDLNGQPALVLAVENPRDLSHQGMATARVFSGALLVLGIGLFVGSFQFTRSFLRAQKFAQRYVERYQTVVDQSRDAMLLVGRDFRLIQVNPASRELLGLRIGQTQTAYLKSILSFDPPLDEDLLDRLCRDRAITEHHCLRRDGLELDIELSASVIADPGMLTYSLTLHDVSARKKAEALLNERNEALRASNTALLESQERYKLAANGSKDGLWDWNLMSGEIYYSARWKAMLGFSEGEIRPVPEEWFDRVHLDDLVQLRTQLSDHLRNRTEHFECEYRMLSSEGVHHWMLARGMAVWDPAGFAHRIAGSQTDITSRKVIEEQLRYDALHDGLTGMANRTLLIDHLHHVNDRKRRKPDLIFALFFLDLDRFKQVNDSLGHQAGDSLLVDVARRLETGLRAVDTISRFTGPETLARIAGDEFVILLEDFEAVEEVQKVAERVVKVLSAPFRVEGREVNISASVGMVVPDQPYDHVEDIIRDADIAMYQAKQLGGGQVVRFHSEMYRDTLQRMQTENELRRAVERREFEVYYQPIYTLDTDIIVGFEALVRWNHPYRGLLPPAEFIQVAEDTGLIVPMGYFVLEEACRRMQEWSREFPIAPELIVSVNFSARQIINGDLVENVCAILADTGFDPKKLWLEVTESLLVENHDAVVERLKRLRAMGIRIEIDDFGTGYSSLSYLQNLPVDGFKIDRSFVKEIEGDGRQIVKTLVDLGHHLGLTQVAEGVETEDQKEYLRTADCDYIQGFLMSRPVNAAAIEELIKKTHGRELHG